MSPEPEDEVERLLAALRQRRGSGDPGDAPWRLAAGEDLGAAERRALADDPDALRELGLASALLAARGEPHADAARSADAVLARVRAGRRRAGPWRLLAGTLLAAAAALAVFLAWPAGEAVRWSATDVIARATRTGDPELLEFRVQLRPATTCWVVLFAVCAGPDGPDVLRVHPLRPDQLASAAFATWPRDPFAAGAEVVLPPAASDRYPLPAESGFLVLVTSGTALDEPALAQFAASLRTGVGGVVDEAAVARASAGLAGADREVHWQRLRRP